MVRNSGKMVIGWREWVSLPGWDVPMIKAKVDTGARTSSVHAYRVEHKTEAGREVVTFEIHPLQRDHTLVVPVTAELIDVRAVRNPGGGGRTEMRPVVRTTIQLGDQDWEIEITLTRRDEMGFRMLLGRSAVRGRYVVDPGRSFVVGKQRRTKGSKKQ